jgi:hypothetical protein
MKFPGKREGLGEKVILGYEQKKGGHAKGAKEQGAKGAKYLLSLSQTRKLK